MLKWVFAIVNYYAVARTVNPKRAAVAQGGEDAAFVREGARQDKKGGGCAQRTARGAQGEVRGGTAEQKGLKDEAELMERVWSAAEKLISGLASERVRWTATSSAGGEARNFSATAC